MCLSFPGRVTEIRGQLASIDYGADGIRRDVNISLVEVRVGSYVLVQGGFAIRVLSEEEAKETLETWKMIQQELEESAADVESI